MRDKWAKKRMRRRQRKRRKMRKWFRVTNRIFWKFLLKLNFKLEFMLYLNKYTLSLICLVNCLLLYKSLSLLFSLYTLIGLCEIFVSEVLAQTSHKIWRKWCPILSQEPLNKVTLTVSRYFNDSGHTPAFDKLVARYS